MTVIYPRLSTLCHFGDIRGLGEILRQQWHLSPRETGLEGYADMFPFLGMTKWRGQEGAH